jgi:hypothetical protein
MSKNFFFVSSLISCLIFAGNVMAAPNTTAPEKQKASILAIDFKKYYENLSDNYNVEKMDSMGKGTTDMISVFLKGDNGERILAYQLFDVNRDGKLDMANVFQKGKRIRTEFDLDYDGKVDTVSEYNPESGELERKITLENNALTWRYWYKNELRRKEIDRNADDKPDMWVHYRNGKVLKTEVDVNFDGKNIRVEGDLSKGRRN